MIKRLQIKVNFNWRFWRDCLIDEVDLAISEAAVAFSQLRDEMNQGSALSILGSIFLSMGMVLWNLACCTFWNTIVVVMMVFIFLERLWKEARRWFLGLMEVHHD